MRVLDLGCGTGKQIFALIVILMVDRAVSPQFFDLRLQDGRLFGSMIDVLNRGTPVALLLALDRLTP